jgi:transaldolase
MAQRTYRAYRSLLHSPRWQRVYNAGARTQRLLWASVGNKDPTLSELHYVRALTAPFTVITMPEGTLRAVAERGEITTMLRADGGTCERTLADLAAAGVDVYALATELQEAGTRSFVASWNAIMKLIASKASSAP